MSSTRSIVTAALAIGVLAVSTGPVFADDYSFKDGRDVKNPKALDIVSVRTGHKGRQLLHVVKMDRRFTPKTLSKTDSFISFAISTDNNFGDVERRVYILGGRRFRAFVTNAKATTLIGFAKVYRPNAKTVGAVVSPSLFGAPVGYLWYGVAVSNGGAQVDASPNRVWLIHDLTAPKVSEGPTFNTTKASTGAVNATAPVVATVVDKGWMDGRGATLRWRTNGHKRWTDGPSQKWKQRGSLSDRLAPRTFRRSLALPQGTTDELCLSVVDFAGNWSAAGPTLVQVPYDDEHAAIVPTNGSSDPRNLDYGGSHTVLQNALGATVTITVPAGLRKDVMVSGSKSFSIDVAVNGGATKTFDDTDVSEGLLNLGSVAGWHPSSGGDDVIVITVTGGELDLDGYLGAPKAVASEGLAHCGGRPSFVRARVAAKASHPAGATAFERMRLAP